MAENIGDAQISIEVALEELRNQLRQAQAEVEKTIAQTKKDIELNVKTNIQGELQKQFDNIKGSFQGVQDEVQKFSDEGEAAFGRTGSAVEQYIGKITGLEGVFAGMLPKIVMVGAVVGAAAVAFGTLAAAVYLSREEIKEKIQADEDLSDALATVTEYGRELGNMFDNLYQELKDNFAAAIVSVIKNLVDMWNEMNAASGAGDNLLNSITNLISQGLQATIRILESVINFMSVFINTTVDSASETDSLSAATNGLAGGMNALAGYIETVSKAMSGIINWASKAYTELKPLLDILDGIMKFSGANAIFQIVTMTTPESTGTGVNFDPNAVSANNPEAGNFTNYGEQFNPGTQEGKNEWAKNLNKQKSNSGSNASGKEKEVDLAKEEKKVLDEIIDRRQDELSLVEKMITLGQADSKQRDDILQSYMNELEAQKSLLQFSDNISTAENKIYDIKILQKKTLDEIVKQEQEAYKLIVDKAGKETESIKDYLKNNTEAEQKLKALKLQNEGDEKAIALNNIEDKYRKEIQNINLLKISEETKIKIIRELEIKKSKEIEDININSTMRNLSFMQSGFNAVTSAISTGFTNVWNSVFGEAHSLFQILIKGIYDQLIALAASAIFKTIIKVLSGGSSGFLSFLFGEGGYTGDGRNDEPAGIVHRNEFVVSAAGTSISGNRELLEAMNRGEDVASLIGSVERRNVNSESIRARAFSQISSAGFGTGERNVNINIDGVNVNAKIQKLTGLNENDWMDIVDNELMPQISKGLKRAGKEVLDNSIN